LGHVLTREALHRALRHRFRTNIAYEAQAWQL
jgi:hypothetical protein